MATIGSLPRMTATQLSELVLAQAEQKVEKEGGAKESKLAIVDVRDDDHIGGHIRTSTHVPSSSLDYKLPELVRKFQDKEVVVFHCALSQVRGPKAALGYLRERERLLGKPASSTAVGEAMRKSATETKKGDVKDGEWEDVDGAKEEGEDKETKEQKVYVLDNGFVGWAESYGEDERLTEGFSKELWKDGYWM